MLKLLEFFSEENKQLSNMRLNCTVLVFTGCFLTCYALVSIKAIDANVIAAAAMLITTGIGGKIIQKKDETKPNAEPQADMK